MARYKWAEFTGREIKFKPATFYLGVADHLARVVEGQDAGSGKSSEEGERGAGENAGTSQRREGEGAEGTRAGEGVSTVEGVEHQGPRSASASPTPSPVRLATSNSGDVD
jgi:triacylglycerol lipase